MGEIDRQAGAEKGRLLLQILFSIRGERQLVEASEYNLLYRWLVGLNIADKVWDHSTFSANSDRLFN